VYQLKVTLQDIHPLIWRRIQVWEDATLAQLHRVLQIVMGWEDCHLHEVRIGKRIYGVPDPDDDLYEREVLDDRFSKLRDIVSGVGSEFLYVYDFGDDWRHDLLLEAISLPEPDSQYPRCVAGERSAPPEDVGGVGGYDLYLETMADPGHREHEDMLRWRGPFDPESFSLAAVNQELRKKFRLAGKTAAKAIPRAPTSATSGARESRSATLLPRVAVGLSKDRRQTPPDEKVHLELNARERDLILQHTFAPARLTGRLRIIPKPGESLIYGFTLGDLDELAGYVAAEATHARGTKLRNELHQLSTRIGTVLSFCMDKGGGPG